MKRRNLINWQATYLGEALWAHQQGERYFEDTTPLRDGEPSPFKVCGGGDIPKPSMLSVRVSKLEDAEIPEHYIYLMAGDYDRALAEMDWQEREAWNEFVDRNKRSAIFGAKTRTRKRVEGGRVTRTYQYCYVEANAGSSKALQRAVQIVLGHCDLPKGERIKQMWADHLASQAEELPNAA